MMSKLRILLPLALVFVCSQVFSAGESVIGVWQTESSEKGYIHVSVDKCGEAVCGTILSQMNLEGEANPDYEHLGKQMVWDMKSNGELSWAKGKIWDPSKDKTYKSKMTLSGDVLKVSGCIAFICKSQSWTRVAE